MLSGIVGSIIVIAGVGYTTATTFPTKAAFEVVQLQVDDIYQDRLKGITKETAQYEKKLEHGKELRPAEKQRYEDLKEEYNRVRKMQKGK